MLLPCPETRRSELDAPRGRAVRYLRLAAGLVVAGCFSLVGCGHGTGPPASFHPTPEQAPAKPPPPADPQLFLSEKGWSTAQDPAVRDLPSLEGKSFDPDRLPRQPAARPEQVAIRQILIRHSQVTGAPRHPRDKPSANRRATHLARLARMRGTDFTELARRYSEEPPDQRGAFHLVRPGTTAESLERVAFSVGFDQVSNPVDTYRGFYVVMPVEVEYSTAHILVQHRQSKAMQLGVERTREKAKKKAEAARRMVLQPTSSFAKAATIFSDSPTKERGGVRRPMMLGAEAPEFEPYLDAVVKLKVGEVSPVVETEFGFHVIKRLELVKVRVRHILVSFTGSTGRPSEPRTRLQALRIALQVLQQLKEGASFTDFAKRYSDCPSAAKGGELPAFARGVMPYPLEQAAFALKPGERVSDLVETRLGFHIVERIE